MKRRDILVGFALFLATPTLANAKLPAQRLVAAAERQIGRTVIYDPAYVALAYPGGDVAIDRGVCTDVVIRAYRDGLGVDLQKLAHEDMKANFTAYPKTWGLKKTDTNIDHRRVPNLQRFFERRNAKRSDGDYQPGDLVSMMLPGYLPHIAIVSASRNEAGSRWLAIHNIGAGARREDVLDSYPITGHYRFFPA
jgi:uncharacterized protein